MLRAGVVPDGGGTPREVWAAAPDVAAALVVAGLDDRRVQVVAPAVEPFALGSGDEGVLRCARPRRSGLRGDTGRLRGIGHVRLLPTAAVRGLAEAVRDVLPGAELLAPCADEHRFAAMAARAGAVLAADADNLFERRALVAAATGAAVVSGRPDGPAAAAGVAFGDLAVALTANDPAARADRQARVRAACDQALLAGRVAALIGSGA